MTRVTPSQMRVAIRLSVARADQNPPKMRLREIDLLREHLGGVEALVDEIEADPEWLAELRERATRRRVGRGAE